MKEVYNEGCEVYITVHLNIDFFRQNIDNQTTEYLDMLLSLGYSPIITKLHLYKIYWPFHYGSYLLKFSPKGGEMWNLSSWNNWSFVDVLYCW